MNIQFGNANGSSLIGKIAYITRRVDGRKPYLVIGSDGQNIYGLPVQAFGPNVDVFVPKNQQSLFNRTI